VLVAVPVPGHPPACTTDAFPRGFPVLFGALRSCSRRYAHVDIAHEINVHKTARVLDRLAMYLKRTRDRSMIPMYSNKDLTLTRRLLSRGTVAAILSIIMG